MAEKQLQDKVIVITGASSGFGKGAARDFAKAGASVVLAARRGELLEELARECEALGGRALAVTTDVADQSQMESLAEAAVAQFGRIDVWVNNAGAGALGRFEEVPLADHVQVIETDLLGMMYGSYFAMKHFRQRGEGTLINMSSVIGKVPAPYFASYAAAKHGVVGLSAALRQEIAQDKLQSKIHVCTIMPTSMDTPFFEHAANYLGHETEPIPPTYDPQKVIDTIVKMVTDPEDEVSVGAAGKFFSFAHQLMPGIVEKIMAKQTRMSEIQKAPPASETSGSLAEPMATGTEVSGGRLKK